MLVEHQTPPNISCVVNTQRNKHVLHVSAKLGDTSWDISQSIYLRVLLKKFLRVVHISQVQNKPPSRGGGRSRRRGRAVVCTAIAAARQYCLHERYALEPNLSVELRPGSRSQQQ